MSLVTYRERQEIYTAMFGFMLSVKLHELPTNVDAICDHLNIECVPLSRILRQTSFTARDIFAAWGNTDGQLMPFFREDGSRVFKIAFNDCTKPERQRFTKAEEIAHFVLGHYQNPMYRYDSQLWDARTYAKHEESARIATGLFLTPPPVFYEIPALLNASDIQYLCDISYTCAMTREDVMKKYRREIQANPLYEPLRDMYEGCIANIPCPLCGGGNMLAHGICVSCANEMAGFSTG